jgi:response regulator RpfG family c-di-GMP phosphodiesterase
MNEKILFVDDDTNLLASCERIFRRQFPLETAAGAEAGLAKLANGSTYSVVVADRQMPGMDGITFLTTVRQKAPDTVRMMLTGNADMEHAIRVVNEGNIFRFLTKPCAPEVLSKALKDAQDQYRLITAEKDLLNKTLNGSIKLLTDILALVENQSFSRDQALRDSIAIVADRLRVENAWEIHLAVMLASIGYVTVPPETLVKSHRGQKLTEAEDDILTRVPETAARLLANIPRLEGVARIVRYQNKHFDGSGFPPESISGENIPLGSRLLKILLDVTKLQRNGMTRSKALDEMQRQTGVYDPALLATVRACDEGRAPSKIDASQLSVSIRSKDLAAGMVLRSNVETLDGTLILCAGHQLNEMALEKIRNFERVAGIKEPVLVENTMA